MAATGLVGNYYVVPTATAINRATKLCGKRMREYQLLRRHASKLAYWPTGGDNGEAGADLDWDWITSLERKRVAELRIGERINGHNNVRVIFFKTNTRLDGEPMNRIWLLTVFQKDRQVFTDAEIRAFRAMRDLIVQRYYGGSHEA